MCELIYEIRVVIRTRTISRLRISRSDKISPYVLVTNNEGGAFSRSFCCIQGTYHALLVQTIIALRSLRTIVSADAYIAIMQVVGVYISRPILFFSFRFLSSSLLPSVFFLSSLRPFMYARQIDLLTFRNTIARPKVQKRDISPLILRLYNKLVECTHARIHARTHM